MSLTCPTRDAVVPIEFMRRNLGAGDAGRSPDARRAAHGDQERHPKLIRRRLSGDLLSKESPCTADDDAGLLEWMNSAASRQTSLSGPRDVAKAYVSTTNSRWPLHTGQRWSGRNSPLPLLHGCSRKGIPCSWQYVAVARGLHRSRRLHARDDTIRPLIALQCRFDLSLATRSELSGELHPWAITVRRAELAATCMNSQGHTVQSEGGIREWARHTTPSVGTSSTTWLRRTASCTRA